MVFDGLEEAVRIAVRGLPVALNPLDFLPDWAVGGLKRP